jgi:CRP-like cAMP-binding protein/di/tricarboxylate transporter
VSQTRQLTAAHIEVLAHVELFERLNRLELARLAAFADPLHFAPGGILCEQGEPADGIYVVVAGSFGVLATDERTGAVAQVGSVGRGDVVGELALLFDEPRTATIRAQTDGEVLCIEKDRFLELVRTDPSIGLAVAATLGRRMREHDRTRLDDHAFAVRVVHQALDCLPRNLVDKVLLASLLPHTSQAVLEIVFGRQARLVGHALETMGLENGQTPALVQRELQIILDESLSEEQIASAATAFATRLLNAEFVDDALVLVHEHGGHPAFVSLLTRVLETPTALSTDRLDYWLGQLSEEDSLTSAQLALARVKRYVRRTQTAEVDSPREASRRWRIGTGAGLTALLLGLALARLPGGQVTTFCLLLAAAIVLWILELAPASVVGLGLMAAWILTGLVLPDQAAAGFASMDWLFVVSVFGISAAVTRSGLLFRAGLLLVRRLPSGLFWQAGTLLLTGLLLTPLLPTSTGRAAIGGSLARSVAESLRMRDRQPPAAAMGLASWIGSAPLMFSFLNGSSMCLLAWGLMSEASRARFSWVTWALATLPLTIVVGVGGLLMVFLVLRPRQTEVTTRGRVDVQLAVLGPPSKRELAMLVVLLLTVVGLIAAPALHLPMGVVGMVGLVGAVATGNFDRQSMRQLDWDYLVFYGVALSLVRLGNALGFDALIGAAVERGLGQLGGSGLPIVLAIAVLTFVVRLGLGQDQAVLLLSLALIPSAPGLGLDPWVAIVTVLACSGAWLVPSQMPSYLAAYSATEGHLFTPGQSRRAAFGYAAVLLVALTVTVPYWHMLELI